MATKITFVGKPEMGKTTIKKVIFEGEDPNDLVLFPLEATLGTQYSLHDFMDLKISLVDTPGQSLPILFHDEEKQLNLFENASAIIYLFDYPTWIEDSQDVIDDIKKVYEIRKKLKLDTKIILFLHKIDLLINKKIGTRLDIIRNHVLKILDLPEELPLYFTSLHPNLIYTTYSALSDTLSNFSEETLILKEIIEKLTKDLSKTSCFATNKENNLIIQEMTKDFDLTILYYLYGKIYQLGKAAEDISGKWSLVDLGPKMLNMMITDVSNYHSNFGNIFIFSEKLDRNDMIKILDELKKELSQKFN